MSLSAPPHLSPFLALPAEIRVIIYNKILSSVDSQRDLGNGYRCYKFDLSLFRVNQQIYHEAREAFRRDKVFVCIETPWEEAQQHVAVRGYVPIIVSGDRANRFTSHHLKVLIDAPEHDVPMRPPQRFIALLEDLPLFCKMWFYSDLGYPGLNKHLRLTLELRDPYPLEFEHRTLPKSLQSRLVLPFGIVKGLYDVRILGECYESVQKALKEDMAVPYKPPEQCLEEATKLKDAGNEALAKNRYEDAVRLYEESFLAIHIVVEGRSRSVWADAFFQKELQGGTFDKLHGHVVRLILRVRLVANIVLAYLKLNNYDEAQFWGMRTIKIMREMTADEPLREFPAAKEMGKIYYRTGLACKEKGDTVEARQLLKIAAEYLPNDPIVQKELTTVAPQLG